MLSNIAFETSQGTLLWTISLPLAWKKLFKQLKFEFTEKNKLKTDIVESLMNNDINFEDSEGSGIIYVAGTKKQINTFLNEDAANKFPKNKITMLKNMRNDDVILCGIFHKKVKLKYPFYKERQSLKYMFFQHRRVGCYEPVSQHQRQQVKVLNYTDQENFMAKVQTINPEEEMIVIKTSHKIQLEEAMEMANEEKGSDGDSLSRKDIFKIPHLSIKCDRNLVDLIGSKIFLTEEQRKYQITEFFESFSFQIDSIEPTIELEKDMSLCVPDEGLPKLKNRKMCLNRAFWLLMRRKKCHPYMGMYVVKIKDMN